MLRNSVDTSRGQLVTPSSARALRAPARAPSVLMARALAADRPSVAEWAVAVGAIFLLGRYPVLFFRERLAGVLGGPPGPVWENDLAVQLTLGTAMAIVMAFGVRRARPSALLRQPLLLVFCAVVWISVAWSVEPGTSARRALLFVGAAGVGWYVGDRFSLRDQIRLAAYAASIGLALSLVAIAVWPEFAMVTNWVVGLVSGVYRSRSFLAPIVGLAVLACLFMLRTERPSARPAVVGLAAASFFLMSRTGARTTTVAFGTTAVVVALTHLVRSTVGRRLPPAVTALSAVAALGGAAAWLYSNIEAFLRTMGRTTALSGRTEIWDLNLWFLRFRPWTGWGFEAIWAHPATIEMGHQALGRFPFSSHNGYFEVLLGVGWIGFGLLCAFLAVAVAQALLLAARSSDAASLWPLAVIVYVVLHNISDSYFVSGDAFWALTVAAAVAATEANRRLRSTKG